MQFRLKLLRTKVIVDSNQTLLPGKKSQAKEDKESQMLTPAAITINPDIMLA